MVKSESGGFWSGIGGKGETNIRQINWKKGTEGLSRLIEIFFMLFAIVISWVYTLQYLQLLKLPNWTLNITTYY